LVKPFSFKGVGLEMFHDFAIVEVQRTSDQEEITENGENLEQWVNMIFSSEASTK
jgi:hypothetical protein